jgi:hypothetical protein
MRNDSHIFAISYRLASVMFVSRFFVHDTSSIAIIPKFGIKMFVESR